MAETFKKEDIDPRPSKSKPASSGQAGGSGGGKKPSPGTPKDKLPEGYVDDALSAIDKGELKASGAHLDDLTSHAQSAAAKAERGLSNTQSAHTSARAAMRSVRGYDPRAALTRLLDKVTHRGFDDYWKAAFRQMAKSGQKTISVADYYRVMVEAIKNNPHFRAGEAKSMVELLKDELFVQNGLKETDKIRLPYSK